MGKLLFLVILIFQISSGSAFAQSRYNNFSDQELEKLYKSGCEHGEAANCLQLSLLYSKYNKKAKANEYIQKACSEGDQKACEMIRKPKGYAGSGLLFYASLFLIFISVFYIANIYLREDEEYRAQEQLDEQSKLDVSHLGFVLKVSRPIFRRYLTPVVSGLKNRKQIKEKYKKKLATAGLTQIMSPEDFFAFKLFLILGFPIAFVAIRAFLEETWPLELLPGIAAFGFIYPDTWIDGMIINRQREIIKAMPFCVDMLALSVEAGLDFVAAMTKVIEKAKRTPLSDEFETLIKEIKIGSSRAEALRNMAWRVDLIPVSSFSATLIAADSVGASIGPILKALSKEIREKKSAEVEKAAAQAATKMLLGLPILLIAVLIVIAAPFALDFMGGK